MDICLYVSQNFAFIRFPDELTTGSSIMPHKKNPDVFELIRAKCNKLQALPNEIALITANLPSGYHRDMQILKEHFLPAFQEINDCLQMMAFMLKHIIVNENILDDEKYRYLFSVDAVNRRVMEGVPFRDAYREVAREIAGGKFKSSPALNYTHEGSIGNLGNDKIQAEMEKTVREFDFDKVEWALKKLWK
jgi:argininosuccinate lyase